MQLGKNSLLLVLNTKVPTFSKTSASKAPKRDTSDNKTHLKCFFCGDRLTVLRSKDTAKNVAKRDITHPFVETYPKQLPPISQKIVHITPQPLAPLASRLQHQHN
ncbi:jg8839 [Pararge aegeria aegeria]|uniref:Jg8839 protein n=1 Tax=Pararge aegeria aegeria TaxID=348720 RepID=A0A8S4SFV4_9NEOP|nr:jg8839 [Pararge aegeria aegeria]